MAKSRFAILKDVDGDFWEQNKELSYISPFSDFKKEKESSKIMKAIYLLYDQKSKLNESDTSLDAKLRDVNENFLNDKNFEWSEYEYLIDAYKEKCVSFLYKDIEKKKARLLEIDDTIKDLELSDPEEYKMVIEIEKYKDSIMKNIIKLEEALNEETLEQVMEGEYLPSLTESYSLEADDK